MLVWNVCFLIFDDSIRIKMQPELRHVLAHIYYAIECLSRKDPCIMGAMDNLKSIEGLIMFDGDGPEDWESYYKEMMARGKFGKKGAKLMKKPKPKPKPKPKKKCKGR